MWVVSKARDRPCKVPTCDLLVNDLRCNVQISHNGLQQSFQYA